MCSRLTFADFLCLCCFFINYQTSFSSLITQQLECSLQFLWWLLQQINVVCKTQVIDLTPLIDIPLPRSLFLSLTLSRCPIKVFGETLSPCRVPLVMLNHSSNSPLIRTSAFAFLFMSCRILTSFSSILYDFIIAHVLCWSSESNACWKSTKQLYIFMPFLLALSASSLSISICCVVLLSFLNHACSSAICAFNCASNLFFRIIMTIFPIWLINEMVR